MTNQQVGIVDWGCYIPATRLPLSLIHTGSVQEGGPEKAVAGFDEDAITLAVAAAIGCLGQRRREEVDGLYFASTTSPFREKQGAAFVARALDLRDDVSTIDFTGSLRAAAGALCAAVNAVQAGAARTILVVAADCRLAAPRSPAELNLGDGAAAFLIGGQDVVAIFGGAYAVADEIYDVWRTEHDPYLRSWEERFNVMHGYADNVLAALRGFFEQTSGSADDYQRVALYGPDPRSLVAAARQAGIPEETLQDALFGRVGNCGAAFVPLLLCAALDEAVVDERVLAVFYGDGAEVLSLDVVSTVPAHPRGIAWHLSRGRALRSYDSYLKSRYLDASEYNRRGGEGVPATVHFRERDVDINFLGQRCTQCGTMHFPATRVCYGCFGRDCFESERLSDRSGRVMSFSFDYFFPSPEPPLIVGMCEVENGARVYVQMTEAEPEELRCDLPVEFVFRKIHDAGNRPNYFWKSRPLVEARDHQGAQV